MRDIGCIAQCETLLATKFGLWLSLVERLPRVQEAVGSNPTSPIFDSASASPNRFLFRFLIVMHNPIRVALIALLTLSSQLFAGESEVFAGRPNGLARFVYPEFPPKLRSYGWNGKGRFLLKVNPNTGDVDEVKILRSTGHVLFDEFSAKAFFQWKFQPGAITEVQVPVEFYTRGYSRDLH